MGNSIFGIGATGLNVAQAGLVTTGHNITNASTPGFSRQEIVQSSNIPQLSGAGFFGQGAQVSSVKRMYSDFLSSQVNLAQTQGSELDSYYAEIKQIDNMLGDVSAGLAPALQDFFSGVNGVAANPASMPSRQAMLSGAQAMTARFQSLDQRLAEIGSGINGAIQSSVGAINSFAKQIAKLNNDITIAESATNMQPANDLRDQRDALIAELGKEIRVTTVTQSDGSYNVFVGNGQPVVVGRQTFDLLAAPSADDAQRTEVGYKSGSTTVLLGSSTLQGGNLGGLLAFRSETLYPTQNAIGRVAIGVAQAFNAQHSLGQDLNGDPGDIFFKVPAPPGVLPIPRTAAGVTVMPTGTVTSGFQDVSALTTSDYRVQYDGANAKFVLTRLSDAKVFDFAQTGAGAGSIIQDGIALNIAGATANDSWLIQPTRAGARDIAVAITDPTKIAAASQIATAAAQSNQGNGTIGSGKVLFSPSWNAAGNSKDFTIAFTVSGAGVTTYDIIDNATGNSWITGNIPTTPYPRAYVEGSAIDFSRAAVADAGANLTMSGVPANGDSFAITNPNTLGTDIVNTPAFGNAGTAAIGAQTITNIASWAAQDLTIAFAVSGGVTTYDVIDNGTGNSLLTGNPLPAGAPYPRNYKSGGVIDLGLPALFLGAQATVSGSPLSGDTFSVRPNSGGVSDSSNVVALAGLQTASTLGKATAGGQPVLNFQQAYAQLVSDVGNKARQKQVMATAQQNLVAQTKQAQQSVAGVNLDDEAANLLRYQQAYQASGKMMQIATGLFQTLLDISR